MRASFQINMYDSDGDAHTEGLFLHLHNDDQSPKCILQLRDIQELDKFIERLNKISAEIHSNF